jgi:hypothetical protein
MYKNHKDEYYNRMLKENQIHLQQYILVYQTSNTIFKSMAKDAILRHLLQYNKAREYFGWRTITFEEAVLGITSKVIYLKFK